MANYLRANYNLNSGTKIFCDEGTVRVLSGIPEDRFVTSADAPTDRDPFLSFLAQQRIQYLVFIDDQMSTPYKVLPGIGSDYPVFELATISRSRFLAIDIRLYRMTSTLERR